MPRASWINDDNHPLIDEHMSQLEHFAQSIADGVIDKGELEKQQDNLVSAMKAVEDSLSDEQHEMVTKVLVELSAYNVMATLHGLASEHAKQAFAGK